MKTFSLLTALCLLFISGKKEKEYPYAPTGKLPAELSLPESQDVRDGILQTLTFPSKYVRKRNVYVWLPVDYYSHPKKHAVLYMHDGQMLFDGSKTWNKQEWGVDETLSRLINANSVRSTIVVGIWNVEDTRQSEYFPSKPFESLTKEQKEAVLKTKVDGKPLFKEAVMADQYLKFIVEELKPYIDKNFSTLPDQQNTYIAGSSMGGLISMYAMCEYPQVFGGAACLSTHWIGTVNSKDNPLPQAFMDYMSSKLPDPKNHKFYFDYGTKSLDAYYGASQHKVDKLMKDKGYTTKNWLTRRFAGHDHSENSWNKRLYIPLTFMLQR